MKRPSLVLLQLCTLLAVAGLLPLAIPGAAPAFAGTMPTTNIPIDGTPQAQNASSLLGLAGGSVLTATSTTHALLRDRLESDHLTLTLPDLSMWGGSHDVEFWKEWSGTYADVYVAWNDLAAPAGSAQQSQTITAGDIAYMGGEFDARIWPSDVSHFGQYEPRPAPPAAGGSRVAIMIYNIRDDAYYSSSPSAFYVGGYFSAAVDDTEQFNAVFVDSFDWPHSTGPGGSIPYLYEGTVAHEFAHLIQHDVDPNEELFVEEGLCELATQFVYGARATSAEVGEYLYYHRDSLTDWKSELFDYGGAVLWMDYLWEQRGGGVLPDPIGQPADAGDQFVWDLVHDPASGLDGIADQLPGGRAQLEQYFRDWTLANLLDGQVNESQWNYRNLALGGADSAGLSIADGVAYFDSGVTGNMPPTRKKVERSADVQAWGAFYRTYKGASPSITMTFSGQPAVGVLPPTGTYEWWAGTGDFADHALTRSIDGVKAGDVLTFQTWFDIEEGFDFGYVEASSDGENWSLLQQTSSLPAWAVNTNESTAWIGPGGLTGATGGWQKATYALGGLTGTAYLRFHYVTDVSLENEGWYIDDIAVGSFADPVDGANGWVTDADNGWTLTDGVKQVNDWTADVYVPHLKAQRSWYEVQPVVGVVGQGLSGQAAVDTRYLKSGVVWGIVSNHPDKGLDASGSLVIRKQRM